MTGTVVVQTETPSLEDSTSTAEIDAAQSAASAEIATEAAQAAVSLANTEAAAAELDASLRVAEIERRMDTKWTETKESLSSLEAMVTNLSAQVQSLASTMTRTEQAAETAVVVATVAAETVLTETPHTDEQKADGSEDGQSEADTERRRKHGKLFRI